MYEYDVGLKKSEHVHEYTMGCMYANLDESRLQYTEGDGVCSAYICIRVPLHP